MEKIGIVTPMSKALVETQLKRATDGEFPTDSINSKLEQIKSYVWKTSGYNYYDTQLGDSTDIEPKTPMGIIQLLIALIIFNKDISDVIGGRNKIESTKVK